MVTWDDMVEMCEPYTNRRDSRDREYGKGMLDLIDVLRSDPEIKNCTLGSRMNWLGLSVTGATGDDFKVVLIQCAWAGSETYDIYLEPANIDDSPDSMRVSLSEVIQKVKELLQLPRIHQD
jgi:hypothetical protein